MRGQISTYKLAFAALLTILLLAPLTLIVPGAQGKRGAIVFDIELYDEKGNKLGDILGRSSTLKDLEIYAQVFAITPPDDPEIITEIYRDKVKGQKLRLENEGKLKEIAEKWVKFEERKGPVTRDSMTAVQLNLFIYNKTSNELVQLVSYYYTYSIKGLIEGEERVYKVKVSIPKKSGKEGDGNREAKVKPYDVCGPGYWKLVYLIVPENNTQLYGGHIKYSNGAWYVRTPILVVYNYPRGQNPITASIDIIKPRWYAVTGIGDSIEAKLKSGDITGGLNGKVYISGPTREDKVHFFFSTLPIEPGKEAYIWVWLRPVFAFYKLYGNCYEVNKEKVDFFVQDYLVWYDSWGNKHLDGGMLYEPLPRFLQELIYNDSLTSWSEEPYDLPAGREIALAALIGTYIGTYASTCEVDFKTPIKEMLAAVAKSIPQTRPFAPLIAMLAPSFGYVGGGLTNHGSSTEYLWFRMSKLQYRKDPPWWCPLCSPCYYNVPVSMYIISD